MKKLVEHKIVVLVPLRNVGNYIIDCVNSIFSQKYSNYEVFLLDDNSTDGALDLIDDGFDQIHKVRNDRRLGATENIYNALIGLPINDEDIVALVDGDDYVFGEFAFQIINEKYNSNILLTYGQYIDSFGRLSMRSPYTRQEFSDLRKVRWKASHLKTFKYKLFKELSKQDPDAEYLKFENGQFYIYSSDVAFMIPLMEIAGYKNVKKINDVIYCYRLHSNNDHATIEGRDIQIATEMHIKNRKPFIQAF